jgi:ribonuclease E
VDGYVISVAGAAGKVGKRMKIRIERATRTSAYAVLTSARPRERPVEAADLAELELEGKPRSRRRPPRKKVAETPPAVGRDEGAEGETDEVDEPTAGAGERPRRKTRRGSRGGRGRTKKKVAAEITPEGAVDASEPEPEQEASVGAASDGSQADGEPDRPRRKTRRGSRGGRNRRRRAPGADGAEGAEVPVGTFAADEEPG